MENTEGSSEIHLSLKPWTNSALMVVWAFAVAVLIVRVESVPWAIFAIAFVLGGVAGVMQTWSLEEGALEIVNASSMMDVRNVMKSTKWGKRYLILLWASVISFVFLSILTKSNIFVGTSGAYLIFMFVREAVSLKACFRLETQLTSRGEV